MTTTTISKPGGKNMLSSPTGQTAGRTRTAELVALLRQQILNAELKPGDRLRFEELREQLDAGMSPLREALTRLAADGLVTLEEHKGYRVAPVSRADLLDLAQTRSDIESLLVRRSITHGDDAWEGRILASLHELGKKTKLTANNEIDYSWEDLHQQFHFVLVSQCRSPRLLQFRQLLADQAVRYRRLSVQYLHEPRNDLEEHREIAEAVIARRADDAERLLRRHYMRTVEILLEEGPELFA